MKNFILGMLGGLLVVVLAGAFYILGIITGYSIAKPASFRNTLEEVK